MRRIALRAVFLSSCVSVALAMSPALAQPVQPPGQAASAQPAATPSAAEFVSAVMRSNDMEIATAELAVQRSQNAAVVDFAQMMLADHVTMDDRIATIANAERVLPTGEAGDNARLDGLTAETAAFDRAYVDLQVEAHQDAIALFEAYSSDGDNAALRAFATDTLPTLRAHLQRAEELRTALASPGQPGAQPAQPAGPAAPQGQAPAQQQPAAAAGAAGATVVAPVEGAAQGEIVIQQPAPIVQIEPAETRVRVNQPAAEVNVQQAPPEIIVTQPPPTVNIQVPRPIVTIDIPQPEIVIRLPDPTVNVAIPEPQILVEQGPPQVRIEQPPPEVVLQMDAQGQPAAAAVQGQTAPAVVEMGDRPTAQVTIGRAEPTVSFAPGGEPVIQFQDVGEPQVQINRVGEPTIRVERMDGTPADACQALVVAAGQPNATITVERANTLVQAANQDECARVLLTIQPAAGAAQQPAQPAAGSAAQQPAAAQGAAPAQPDALRGSQPAAEANNPTTAGQLMGLGVFGTAGAPVGQVQSIAQVDGRYYAIVVVPDGARSRLVAVELSSLAVSGDRIVLQGLTPEQIAALPNSTVPETAVLTFDAPVTIVRR